MRIVLAIDSNLNNLKLLEETLESNYQTVAVNNMATACKFLQNKIPDCVFIGEQLLERYHRYMDELVANDSILRRIPVFLMDENLNSEGIIKNVSELSQMYGRYYDLEYILASRTKRLVEIPIEDIRYIEIYDGTCIVSTVYEEIQSGISVEMMLDILKDRFMLLHNNMLIHKNWIEKIEKGIVTTYDGRKIPIKIG